MPKIQKIDLEKQIEGQALNRDSHQGWVKYGRKNDYPNLLLNLYGQSPTHAACINFAVKAIVGEGIDFGKSDVDIQPNEKQTWNELIEYISQDFILYGSFAIQVIRNNDGKTYSFYHLPFEQVRNEPYDAEGNINGYYVCPDWSNTSKYPPVRYEAFTSEENIEKGKVYLYVYHTYSPLSTYGYPTPKYISGLKAIQSEIQYINYDQKTTQNNFVPSGMLILDDPETDEERVSILNNVKAMFQGSDNASAVMISFRRNIEETKPEWIPFSANISNVNIYESANNRTVNRILAAHQINDASLVGLPSQGSTGFNSEGAMLETAFNIYNRVVGNGNRQVIIGALNKMFAMQGIDAEVVMKPMTFDITNEQKQEDKE